MKLEALKTKKKLIIVLAVIILGILAYYFLVYQKNGLFPKDQGQLSGAETQSIIEKVGRLIELPNEQPQVATVSDVTKLPSQPFFARAQNGDKVLVYNIAQKAILYRPSTNKIVDVTSLAAFRPTVEPVQTASPSVTIIPPTPTTTKVPFLTPQITP